MTVDEIVSKFQKLISEGPYTLSWEDVWATLDATEVEWAFVSETRWSIWYRGVVKIGDQYFEYSHEVGATEYQDSGELADELDTIYEVKPEEVTSVRYVKVTA